MSRPTVRPPFRELTNASEKPLDFGNLDFALDYFFLISKLFKIRLSDDSQIPRPKRDFFFKRKFSA